MVLIIYFRDPKMKIIQSSQPKLLAICAIIGAVFPLAASAALPSCAKQAVDFLNTQQPSQGRITTNADCTFSISNQAFDPGIFNTSAVFINSNANKSAVATGTTTPTAGLTVGADKNLSGILTCNSANQWVINPNKNTPLVDCAAPVVIANTGGNSGGTCWKSVSSYRHVAALKKDGSLWTWGPGDWGQLGYGTTPAQTMPKQVGTDTRWVQVSAGQDYTLAINSDGTLWGWGMNGNRGLGDGTKTNKSVPSRIGTDTDWKMVSAGRDHTTAVKTNGTLWSWGWNSSRGTPLDEKPVQVGTNTNWASTSAGDVMGTVLNTSGALMSWGNNRYGSLGIGQTGVAGENDPTNGTSKSAVPLLVGNKTDKWKIAQTNSYNTFAIKSDGSLWGFGPNSDGQLGIGSSTQAFKNTPTRLGSATNWRTVAQRGSAAIKTDGTLWLWGNPLGGTAQLSPSQYGTDIDWTFVTAWSGYIVALKKDGSLWTWGKGPNGQLGNGSSGTSANSTKPLAVSCQ
jgi:alpha-tubulin suppressor-like RCC1 family protein